VRGEPLSTGPLTLLRPDGYIGWIGTPEQFPNWARDYFSPAPHPAPQSAR